MQCPTFLGVEMSVTVIGNWELSWNTPLKESELWNFPLRDFGVKEWKMTPVTGIRQKEQPVNLVEYHRFEDMLADTIGTRVFVEAPNQHNRITPTLLQDFEHPEDAIYIFGSAHLNPCMLYAKEGDLGITLPTKLNNGVLWPHQVLVEILYDRLVKSWRSQ